MEEQCRRPGRPHRSPARAGRASRVRKPGRKTRGLLRPRPADHRRRGPGHPRRRRHRHRGDPAASSQPARVILAAMASGKSVVTANKALLAEDGATIHAGGRRPLLRGQRRRGDPAVCGRCAKSAGGATG
ncbi:hypothetical protein [Nonomuraea dietziae]|uniref:hypothetical protein n=1 Tax=Nonomuraea dietziae TaxID=65515 RepID=UPI0031E0F4C0